MNYSVYGYRKNGNEKLSGLNTAGYTYKTNTKCKTTGDVPDSYVQRKKADAFVGCSEYTPNCTMIVDKGCSGEKYFICFGEPVADTSGSCAWVKGIHII